LRSKQASAAKQRVARIGPVVFAIVGATIAGMLSSTRSYTIPTYMVLGLASAYLALLGPAPEIAVRRFDIRFVRHIVAVGIIVLLALYTYVRLNVRFSG
jgi:hypothetical protein